MFYLRCSILFSVGRILLAHRLLLHHSIPWVHQNLQQNLGETPFKGHFRNHKKEFTHKKYRDSTELPKYIWQLKDINITPTVTWKVVAMVFSDIKINFCKLCLTETVFIINALDDSQLLNKKSELINTCRHQNKWFLKCLKNIIKDMMVWIRNLMFRLF